MEKSTNNIPIKIKGYEDTCPICYEYWADAAPWLYPCGHMICELCYLKHKKTKTECHICREKFNLKQKKKNRNRKNKNSDSESGTSWSSRGTWEGLD